MADDLDFNIPEPATDPVQEQEQQLGNGVVHPTGHGGVIPHTPTPNFTQETGFTPEDWDKFRGYMAQRESSHYGQPPMATGSKTTPYVMGRYQQGPEEIINAAKNAGISEPTVEGFLQNPQLQEQLFEQYTLDHHRQLMSVPQYAEGDTATRAAILAGAHLHGANGMKSWLRGGEDTADKFGTHTSNYVKSMYAQFGGGNAVAAGIGGDDPDQPFPTPTPGHAPGPRNIGPYPTQGAAYQAIPNDAENYQLLKQGDGFTWVPTAVGDKNPQASPYFDFDQSEQIVNQANTAAPHSFSNEIDHLVANLKPTFLSGLAGSLDLPVELAEKGLRAIGHASGTQAMDFNWGTPVADWMKRNDWNTTPLYKEGWGADVGSGAGYGVGSALPFLVAGAVAEPFAGASAMARGLARWMGNPLSHPIAETIGAASAGVGGQEAHEFYKGQTGREGDWGDFGAQLFGGGLFNLARLGLLTAFEKTAGGAWAKAFGSATGGEGAKETLTPVTGMALADRTLHANLESKIQDAEQTVATFHRNPQDSASYLAEQSKMAARAVDSFAQGTRQDERAFWGLVNTNIPRDYSTVNAMWDQMRNDHFDPTRLRDPKDWPKEVDNLFGSKATRVPGGPEGQSTVRYGLADTDTLGRGQDARAALNYAIEQELTTGGQRPVNAAKVGYLQKIRNELVEQLESGGAGASPEEIRQYQLANWFSGGRAKIMESPEMRKFLDSGDATALKSMLRTGPEGSDAANVLINAASAHYGSDGLLSAAKDTIRQHYSDAVAPNGYVSLKAHDNFMQNWGATLNHPSGKFDDVRRQFEQAALAEGNVNNTVGVGRPGGFGNSPDRVAARTAATENYLHAPVNRVLDYLEKTTSPQLASKRIVDQLGEGHVGPLPPMGTDAQQGFQHALAGRSLSDTDYVKNHLSMFQAFDGVNPGFSERALAMSTPSSMAGVMKWVRDLTGAYVGAQLGQKVAGQGLGSSMVMASRGSDASRALLSGALDKAFRVTSAAIVDPNAHGALSRLMGNLPSTLAGRAADIFLMHAWVPGFLGLNTLNSAAQAGSGQPGAPLRTDAAGNKEGSAEWWKARDQQSAPQPGPGQPAPIPQGGQPGAGQYPPSPGRNRPGSSAPAGKPNELKL